MAGHESLQWLSSKNIIRGSNEYQKQKVHKALFL